MNTVTVWAEFFVAHLAEFGGWAAVLGVLVHYLADLSSKRTLQDEASRLTEKVNELAHELKLRESAYGKHLDLLLEYYSIFYRHYRLCQNATNQDAHQFPDGHVVKTRDVFFEQLDQYLSESKAQEAKARLVLPAHLLALHEDAIDAFNEFKDAMKRTTYDEIFHESKRKAFAKVEATKSKLESGLRMFLRTEHLLKVAA